MKLLKSIAASLTLTAALASVASAQSTIRVTGSSAYRKAAQNAEINILVNDSTRQIAFYSSSDLTGASVSIIKGNTIASVTPGGVSLPVIFKNAWSGSVGGVRTVDLNQTLPNTSATPKINVGWLVDGTATTSGGGTNLGSSAPAPASTAYEQPGTFADVAMSDSIQGSTPFVSQALTAQKLGVVEFVFAKQNGAPASISNISPNFFKTAVSVGGSGLLSMLSGNSADSTAAIYVAGRDADSGTRLGTFAETGYGKVGANCDQVEFLVGAATASGPFLSVDGLTDAGANSGASGFNSGGNLANNLMAPGNDPAVTSGWGIGYLGINDAASIHAGTYATATSAISGGAVTSVTLSTGGTLYSDASTLKAAFNNSGTGGTGATATLSGVTITGGVITAATFTVSNGGSGYTTAPAVKVTGGSPGVASTGAADSELTYNGVPYTRANIQQGLYTFWTYEFLMYRPLADAGAHSPVFGVAGTYTGTAAQQNAHRIVDAVATQLSVGNTGLNGNLPQTNDSGIILSTMSVSRAFEGGNITHN